MANRKPTLKNRGVSISKRIVNQKVEGELGFGKHILTEGRMMNGDGSFNVTRVARPTLNDMYLQVIRMPWSWFFTFIVLSYLLINSLFALAYVGLGVENLVGIERRNLGSDFFEAFFFSTQTLTTVGYGRISPIGFWANVLASIESLLGLMSLGLISGLLYGRFSRPVARIAFSKNILIAPYRTGKGLMLRMVNKRKSELLQTSAQLMIAINQTEEDGTIVRSYHNLPLELNKITFFSMSWTLVHPLNENSPLDGFTEMDFLEGNAEVMVLISGTDEATEQIVTARRSYLGDEMVWNAKFTPAILRDKAGNVTVVTSKVGDYEVL